MTHEIPTGVVSVAGEQFKYRKTMSDAVGWIKRNREVADSYSLSFDEVIARFNNAEPGAYPDFCTNMSSLKAALGDRKLPTLKQIFRSCTSEPLPRYSRVLSTIDQMMETGDRRDNDPHFVDLPYLTYQEDAPSEEDVFVGSLFHFYEEWLIVDEKYGLQNRRDIVVNALVETLGQDTKSLLFDPISSPSRLNWIKDYEDFSREFRESTGFPEDAPTLYLT